MAKTHCLGLEVDPDDGVTCLGCGRMTSMATGVLQHRRGRPTGPPKPTRPRIRPPRAVPPPPEMTDDERIMAAWERGFDRARNREREPRRPHDRYDFAGSHPRRD